jgi:hypothetical protein
MRQNSKSPAATILCILQATGYAESGAEMGRLLRIAPKNVHRYLQPETGRWRISPRLETLAQWCWALSQTTGLSLRIIIDSSGELDIEASGYAADGSPVPLTTHNTSYREWDQIPLQSWSQDWREFLTRFRAYYVDRSTDD